MTSRGEQARIGERTGPGGQVDRVDRGRRHPDQDLPRPGLGPGHLRDLHIAGFSQKMLTQTLRNLERDGLVTRAVTPSAPVRVDYALTGLGESPLPVVQVAKAWANPTSTRSTGPAPPTTAAEQPR